MQRTTIAVSPRTRDRLQLYGRKGMSYEQILESLMDAVDPAAHATPQGPPPFARGASLREIQTWRVKSASEKLAVAEEMRRLAVRTNPKGARSLIEFRRRRKPR